MRAFLKKVLTTDVYIYNVYIQNRNKNNLEAENLLS